jgi:signal peptidase I
MEGTIMVGQRFYVTPTKNFHRNDIVVFDYVGEDYGSINDETGKYNLKEEKRVFRLLAISGDVLEIKKGEVYVNNIHIPLPSTAKIEYEVDSRTPVEELEKKDPAFNSVINDHDTLKYFVQLTITEARGYEGRPGILGVKKNHPEINIADTFYAKASSEGLWSSDYYGPLNILSPGDTILVNEVNFKLFHNIPSIKQGLNILKEKLYFVMGDNRHASEDSRFIGFIPQSKMYGIVK